MKILRNLSVLLLIFMLGSAFTKKGNKKDVYMAGVSASFSDSLVYFTNVQLVDSVELDKDDLLPQRQQYSYQLKTYLQSKGESENRTCFIYFNTNKEKLEKEMKKLKEKYQKGGKSILRQVDADFKFTKAIIY